MSYTKFAKEVNKWLKENNMPYKGTAHDSEYITQKRLDAWKVGSKHILNLWIKENRYKELISVAHSGWYSESEIFEPLAEYFTENKLFNYLLFLCERDIRFTIENMLSVIKYAKENNIEIDLEKIILIKDFNKNSTYNYLEDIAEYRSKVLNKINRYLYYLNKADVIKEYINLINNIKESVFNLTIKKEVFKPPLIFLIFKLSLNYKEIKELPIESAVIIAA